MEDADVLRVVAAAVAAHNERWRGSAFREEYEHCGLLAVRLVLIRILAWLDYLGRQNRIEPLRVIGVAPVGAFECVLGSGGDLSRCFEMMDNNVFDWRPQISASARAVAVRYVQENLVVVMRA